MAPHTAPIAAPAAAHPASACDANRRLVVTGAALFGAAALSPGRALAAGEEADTVANEDLMREHGVLRRALLVYVEAGRRLRQADAALPMDALHQTARLFRTFGEDYHESTLEEKHVFPAVTRAGGSPALLTRTLLAQHRRGRQITDYVMTLAKGHRPGGAADRKLADVLDGFVLMYQHHAAVEDTVLFPAWKKTLSADRYRALGERFEALERQMVGAHGFDEAVKTISQIEGAFGIANLAQFTPPAPAAGDRG